MAKKVAISGYYGFKNFGDEMILSILCDKLKNAELTVFSVDPEYTSATYGVNSVKTFDPFAVVKTIAAADTLISGGGSLFQDATSLKSVIYYAFVLGFAQLLGKKTIVFAQGVGPLYSPISRFLVKTLFKRANFVSVRDEKSFSLLEKWGVKAELVQDPAYSLTLPACQKGEILGVQLRKCSTLDDEFLQNLAYAVSKSEFSAVKVFSLQETLDLEVCETFAKLLQNLAPAKKVDIIRENLVEELCGVKTLVSMRFHALIVALRAGVKCAVINYDPKVQILAEKYSLPLVEISDNSTAIAEKIKNSASAKIEKADFPWEKVLKFVS